MSNSSSSSSGSGGRKRKAAAGPSAGPSKACVKKACPVNDCDFQAVRNTSLRDHIEQRHLCCHCSQLFLNVREHICERHGERLADQGPREINLGEFFEHESAHLGYLKNYSYLTPANSHFDRIDEFYNFLAEELLRVVAEIVRHYVGIRLTLSLLVHLVNLKSNDEQITWIVGESVTVPTVDRVEIAIVQNIMHQIETLNSFTERGSLWNLFKILRLDLNIGKYTPLQIGAGFKTPAFLRGKKGLIILKSPKNLCFLYAICAARYFRLVPTRFRQSANKYKRFLTNFSFSSISTPTPVDEIVKFEKLNPSVGVNVHVLENRNVYPLIISKKVNVAQLDLLIMSKRKANKHHYAAIYDLNKFLSTIRDNKTVGRRNYYCRICYNYFGSELLLNKHNERCQFMKPKVVKYPSIERPYSCFDQFSKFGHCQQMSYCGTFDFEVLLKPYQYAAKKSKSEMRLTHLHEPSSYCIIIWGPDKTIFRQALYQGPNSVSHFFKTALQFADDVIEQLKINNERELTEEEEVEHEQSTHCPLCFKPFGPKRLKCKHHHHIKYFNRTSQLADGGNSNQEQIVRSNYIQTICSWCNLQIKEKKTLTLLAHNASKYDWRLLIRYMPAELQQDIKVLSKNSETFYQILVGKTLRLLDSYRHLTSSLSRLTDDLRKIGLDKFPITRSLFPDLTSEQFDKICFKQKFPYHFMDREDKFDFDRVPDAEHFYDPMTDSGITEEELAKVKEVWRFTGCQTMRDYSNLYLKLDTCLLADCIINYSENSYNVFGIEPLYHISLPSFSLTAMRFMTRKTLIQYCLSHDQILSTMSAIRGGIQLLNTRLCYSNVPDTPGFDPTKPSSETEVWDVNQLYASCLRRKLPTHGFRDLKRCELDLIYQNGNIDLSKYGDKYGAFLTVSLRFPSSKEWQDKYRAFPFAPYKQNLNMDNVTDMQRKSVVDAQTTPNQKKVEQTLKGYLRQSRLMMTMNEKPLYTIYTEELKYYISHGAIIDEIISGFEFYQKDFMKEFVDKANALRQSSVLETLIQLIKNLLNAIFGKLITNVFLFDDVVICRTARQCKRLLSKHTYKSHFIVSENLSIFSMKRQSILFKSHYIMGAVILSLSKLRMYSLYYNYILPYFERRVSLLYMDTDSLVLNLLYLEGETSLVKDYEQLKSIFDRSNKNINDPCFSLLNKSKPGCLKSEVKSLKVLAFGAYCMKRYFMVLYDRATGEYSRKIASGGISRHHMTRIEFDEYARGIITNPNKKVQEYRITSFHQELFTIRLLKIFLNNIYLHRRVLSCGIHTVPYGYLYNNSNNCDCLFVI